MKKFYQCNTCKGFDYVKPVKCSVCSNEMCDLCANEYLCPVCFELKEQNKLLAEPIFEDGYLIGWTKNKI